MNDKESFVIADDIMAEDRKLLVFRSNIDTFNKAVLARKELLQMNGIYSVDIDWEGEGNVVRVECHPDSPSIDVAKQILKWDFMCAEFPAY